MKGDYNERLKNGGNLPVLPASGGKRLWPDAVLPGYKPMRPLLYKTAQPRPGKQARLRVILLLEGKKRKAANGLGKSKRGGQPGHYTEDNVEKGHGLFLF